MLKQQKIYDIGSITVDDSLSAQGRSPYVLAKAKKAKAFLDKVGLPKEDNLVDKIAQNAKITRSQAASALDTVIGTIESTLTKGGSVTLAGLGTFSLSKPSPGTGRNPRTGKLMKVKAKKVAKFKASEELLKRVNK